MTQALNAIIVSGIANRQALRGITKVNIGKSIKIGCAMSELTQRDLARQVDVHVATLNQIIKGKRQCRSDLMSRIADEFNMSVSEFIALGE